MTLKKLLFQTARTLGVDIRRYAPRYNMRCVSLPPDPSVSFRGDVLLSYILDPFLLKPGKRVSTAHTHHAESVLIATTFRKLGYTVDVIDYHNDKFVPKKDYVFFVSARTKLETIAKRLNADCVKIAHLDTAHFLFNNAATYARALALQQRRGVASTSFRFVEHNLAIERADYGAVLGNTFTLGTYSYAKKPLFSLPVPAIHDYPFKDNKNYENCRKHFLWLGSNGCVHKGLDLVLEVFAGMADYHLTICGPIQDEKDFEQTYYKELYETPNINTVGWVDVSSTSFTDISDHCIGLIYPSCSEGQAGAVVNCIRAGLIPIISYESGLDVTDFGVILKECSINEIKRNLEMVATLPASRLKVMSYKAWEYAQENHTAEKYITVYRKMITQILADRKMSG